MGQVFKRPLVPWANNFACSAIIYIFKFLQPDLLWKQPKAGNFPSLCLHGNRCNVISRGSGGLKCNSNCNKPHPSRLYAGLHVVWISLHSTEIAWTWNLYSPLLKDYQHLQSDWLKRINLNYCRFRFSLWVTLSVICNDSRIFFKLLLYECHLYRSSTPASSLVVIPSTGL